MYIMSTYISGKPLAKEELFEDFVQRLEGRGSTQIDHYTIDISYQIDQ